MHITDDGFKDFREDASLHHPPAVADRREASSTAPRPSRARPVSRCRPSSSEIPEGERGRGPAPAAAREQRQGGRPRPDQEHQPRALPRPLPPHPQRPRRRPRRPRRRPRRDHRPRQPGPAPDQPRPQDPRRPERPARQPRQRRRRRARAARRQPHQHHRLLPQRRGSPARRPPSAATTSRPSSAKFPETLREVALTMKDLRGFADQGTPLMDDVGAVAPDLSKATQKLRAVLQGRHPGAEVARRRRRGSRARSWSPPTRVIVQTARADQEDRRPPPRTSQALLSTFADTAASST